MLHLYGRSSVPIGCVIFVSAFSPRDAYAIGHGFVPWTTTARCALAPTDAYAHCVILLCALSPTDAYAHGAPLTLARNRQATRTRTANFSSTTHK